MLINFKKTFKKVFVILFYFFINIQSIIKRFTQQTNNANILFLNKDNFDSIKNNSWCVTFNKHTANKLSELTTNNVAFLCVNSFETGKLAARLQPKEYSEVIYLENGEITSKYGKRHILNEEQIQPNQVFDYLCFFIIKEIKHNFLNFSAKDVVKTFVESLW
ncbi:hypothetical protein EHP00_428 [Ecytonucleospora hepatopenaei]|uniref:Uncharacterized protein n=1 Tax=Ecytonucleospora hepatopenaei TaxID=646526 RepID=A0A1W0E620_9MICR|nr:hypothetical protein EHP00_428 [Ecytonucleospora hepatopenaei]